MIYSKHGAEVIKERLVSKSQRYSRKLFISLFKVVLVAFVFIIVVAAGAGFGMMKGILDNAPDINNISIKPKGFKSTIYNPNGTVSTSLSMINSNRIYVYYEDIPQDMINAFVAIEDERFWSHNGIDIRGIIRAAVRGIKSRNFDEGASTITQQLIKNQVFNVGMDETTFLQSLERKIWEQSLAIELEKKYTKKQILEYYLNTIYLGNGVNGIEAASERYFGKAINQLSISEISVIAGITQNPYQFDPIIFPEYNAKRRKLVLKKMLDLKYIDKATYDECLNDNVYSRIQQVKKVRDDNAHYNTYFTDEIIKSLKDDFMEMYGMSEAEAYNEVYTGGYSIYSTQDKGIQAICDKVVNDDEYYPDNTAVALEYVLTLSAADGMTKYNYDTYDLLSYFRESTGDPYYNNIYSSKDTARAAANRFIEAMIDKTGASFEAEDFTTSPQPQCTFVIMDQKTGYVKAIVGGRGEKTGNLTYDRATMGTRQPGSTFKVLAAFMPYLETGGNLAFTQKDEPYEYADGTPVVNWYGGYYDKGSIRDGIRDSMNIIAVKTLTLITPQVGFDYVNKLGFTTLVDEELTSWGTVVSDITQSLALGGLTYGVTNYEITAAYAAIANGGVYTKPVLYSKVVDHDGNVVIDNTKPANRQKRVMKATTAWMLIDAMKDVVTSGTGTPARLNSGCVAAGKTGTTSSTYDVWFCGMTAYYTASIWWGYDSNVRLGDVIVHKTMWRDIMDKIAARDNWDSEKDIMDKPEDITQVTVCELTGLLPSADCPTRTDYGDITALPKERCPGHEIIKLCLDSHKIATEKCPNTKDFVVTTDIETGKKTIQDADFQYDDEIFTSICDMHMSREELGLSDKGEPIITTKANEGGTISQTTTVPMKATVTVFITPNAGYEIKDVKVDGQSVGPVSEYTLTNVTRGHTIEAIFGKIGEQPTEPEPSTEDTTEESTEETTEETEEPSEDTSEEGGDPEQPADQ